MGLLTFGLNVTLDGCIDHTMGIADDALHDHWTQLMDQSGAMLFGRKTYELMEGAWPAVANDEKAPRAMRAWAQKLEAKTKYVVSNSRSDFPWKNTIKVEARRGRREAPDEPTQPGEARRGRREAPDEPTQPGEARRGRREAPEEPTQPGEARRGRREAPEEPTQPGEARRGRREAPEEPTQPGEDDLHAAIAAIKAKTERGVLVGSPTLGTALEELGLIDEYQIVLHPIISGRGPTLFHGLSGVRQLELLSTHRFASGSQALHFRRKTA